MTASVLCEVHVQYQRSQPLGISNLEILFWTSTPPPLPQLNSLMWPPSPPPSIFFGIEKKNPTTTKQFCKKNVDLFVRVFNWLNTHPIRLACIAVTKKKLSFCLRQTKCIMQENEARSHNTSLRSQMILEFWNIWSLNPMLWATYPNFLLSGSFGHLYGRVGDWLYPGELVYMQCNPVIT